MRKFWFAAAVSVPVMLLSYPDLMPGLRDWMPMGSATRRIVWALLGRAEPARPRLVGLSVLHRHVGRAQAPLCQHAYPDRHRHQRRLPLFGGGRRLPRPLPAHGAGRGVLGRDDGRRCARRSRPRARDQGQGANLRGHQEADRAAGQDRARPARRQGGGPSRRGGGRRRHGRHPPGRQDPGRWRANRGGQRCRRVDDHG